MEDFRGIAEESFPSFLTNSLFGNSGILENVTLSSNLGLPVAVSTLARDRSSTDNRYPDIQASYLVEGRFSVPSGSSPGSQSDAEPRERLQLSFQDDDSISRKKSYVESQRLSNALSKQSALQMETAGPEEEPAGATESLQGQDLFNRASPLEQAQDSPIDFHLQSWMNNKEPKIVVLDAGKHFEDKTLKSDLSHTSLLENEKLILPTSLEDSSDDDIDDEMFYDDHLEAYFEQLAIPGMIYEDLEGPEPPEKGFKLPTNGLRQANENGSLNCKFQSENNSSLISLDSHSSETTHKESEESQVICLPGTSNSIGTGDSRRYTDGMLPFSSGTWGTEKEIENLKGIVPDLNSECASKDVLVKTLRAIDVKLNSDNFHDANANRGGFDLTDPVKQGAECPHQNKTVLHMDGCLDTETPTVSIQENVDVASLKPISDSGINFTDAIWSPTCERRTCECHESIEKNKDKTDLPQSVVYQNEEGRWVTDLAYYTSFNSKQNLNVSLSDEMNEDFRSGSEAFDLIAQDEEEFNKEHQFIQEENIDAHNTSVALGDTSWGATINYSLLRKSRSTSDLDKDDASYLRLSLGEFFAQRSEALGCLGGGNNVKRPSFGYFIRSPEKREPIALIRKSDVSRGNLEKEMAHLNHDLYSGDLNEQSQAQLSEGSITLQVEAVESTSQVDENDVTLTADKGKTEDTFFMSNKPQRYKDKLPDSGDSMLRISTIASAIAEASVNTDPSQLAAMIKALSNKTRDKTFQEDEKQKDYSHVRHFLPNDLEKSNGSNALDMEKYLKKTEVSRYESALENFSRASMSDTWDLSLPKEQTTQDIHPVDLSATSVSVRAPEENTAAIVYVENGESENQESFRTINSSNSVTNRENNSAVVDVKTCSIDNKLQDVGNDEKATSISTPSDSYSSVRNPRITSLCLLKDCEEIRDNRENQRQNECVSEISNSEKHVTFENHRIVSPKNSDLKNTSPEHGGRGSEDEQESFRPSTSPLSHSSPSEISGTSSSGCALESFGSAAQQQQPPCEQELSPLVCSPAGVSRLTYVSEPESSYPTTATDDALEDRKSDITSELSTTIIQGSPAALEERAMEKLREKVPFQNRGKGTLSSIIQNNSDTRKATETTSLSSKPEYVKPDFRWSKDPSSKSGNLLETSEVGWTSNPEELDPIRLALLGKSGLSCQVGSATSHPVSCQEPIDEDQRISPKDKSTAGREFSGQVSHQTTSENQCTPIPSSTVHSSVADMQNMPAAVHALLTQPSLSAAPFAQRYLGTLPSTGSTTLPQCHAGNATVCGFSGGLPYPAVAGEPVQNSVAVGICLGSNIGSGWMGTSSLCNPYSNTLNQNLLSTTKPFPVPSVGTNCGIEPWDSGVTSGLGSVRVPEELKLPHACCVGIASQTLLSVLNPTDRWLQVSIGVLSISVNGEKVDLSTYRCLVFKNKAIIRPHATEEIKVLFIPSSPGVFRCTFSVASWPCSTDAETIVQAEALASTVTLTAIAESPVIEVETEKKDVLDFGDLTYGGWKALPLKLINRTHATVPIRLIINANAVAWRCFTFSKESVRAPVEVAPCADVVTRLAGPSVVNHMMPASYDGQDPEFLMIWVLFHSPKKQISSSDILDSAEEFSAKVDIEVDSPNPTPVLRSVSLRARAGIARIHAPRDLQTMHFLAKVASSRKQHLPLKNAGNIEVYLDIKVPEQGSHFSVDPKNLLLKPGEEHEVIVSFTPKDPEACEERLQKLALRNNSASTTQHLRLLIRGQDQDCFQLQNTFGSEQRLTSNCEIRIHPKEDIFISVLFAPTRLSCMLARLEIKQLGNRSQPGIKFTIPLSGYGGTSNLILEGVKKLSDSYMVTVNGLVPGKESKIVFSVRNTGSRAAFVKAVGFKDSQKKVLLDPKVLRIFPDKFVLKERTQENVTLIYNPSDRGINNKTATELSTVYLFGGDEISRQQYRRALLHKPEMIKQILPEHSVLQNINFVEAFQDELLVTEVYDLPQRPNDVQLFYGSMCKIILSVIGEFRDCISSREFLQPSSKASLESTSDLGASGKHGGNVSLDVLPVKGPQGSPLLSRAARPPLDQLASEEPWTVLPEHLILVAPSPCDMAKTGRFQIVNNSVRLLRFELCWPAHCLTVTPQHGCVAPESKLQILVSPNSSLSTKQSMFPWSGLIYIHCDDGQKKIVKVQIREDLTQVELLTRLTSKPFGILSPVSEPSVSHLVKPMTKPPSTKVEIRNKSITFPTTEPGETSESCLELENHGTTDVKWHLSSLAPPYVKGVDESGDVFRATYAAFRCSPISGLLESHGIQKVSITFLPRGRGDYAQFWDVECHPLKEPHMKHTLRFQLSGQSIEAENEPENACLSTDSLIKIDHLVKPRRQAVSEASARIPDRQLDVTARGVYAPEDVYRFRPTSVGESRTLKVNLRNNSFITHSLKFLSPREPFYVKHSKYSLRAQHYINMPVQFKPKSAGKFEALLVIQTDEGKSIAIRLIGEALGKN
ncbi:centrosomal protein of 192 kDa isoform X4 [Homo sapiens]|uniref:centrosomal protein of 192 kDa isoform X4 n=1 Tax=Homo sapiens TaxID=9606 RepID=UPI0005CFF055|nr:centrosomal protein of 192 kDa isoform X4 [Homo sapiens]XP_054174695.1 centrosomal protein of 192 kDa isoform X4 [Homo sapiens]|eukprot:XP_011523975.1 centrosomal protein of 192 kDa isoform X3 [Homo sapiens]